MPLERSASFTDLHEAELARALLESAGIDAHVADQHLVGLDWQMASALGGVKVLVATEQAAAAREVLAAPIDESAELDASDSSAPLDAASNCPKCGGEGVPANQLDRRLRALSMLFACWNCGARFASGAAACRTAASRGRAASPTRSAFAPAAPTTAPARSATCPTRTRTTLAVRSGAAPRVTQRCPQISNRSSS